MQKAYCARVAPLSRQGLAESPPGRPPLAVRTEDSEERPVVLNVGGKGCTGNCVTRGPSVETRSAKMRNTVGIEWVQGTIPCW